MKEKRREEKEDDFEDDVYEAICDVGGQCITNRWTCVNGIFMRTQVPGSSQD